jgi:hypothetical protein
LSATVAGPTVPFTDYHFRVAALNANGQGEWSNEIVAQFNYNEATGGTVTTRTESGRTFRRHTFTAAGSLVVNKAWQPFRILLIGGGGGGNSGSGHGSNCAGGAPGSALVNLAANIPVGTYPVAVGGPGGNGQDVPSAWGSAGGPSTIHNYTAPGGAPGAGGPGVTQVPAASFGAWPDPATFAPYGHGSQNCDRGVGWSSGGNTAGVVAVEYEVAP